MGTRVARLCQGLSQMWFLGGKDSVVFFPFSLLSPFTPWPGERQKEELNNLCNTVELMKGRYDILVQQGPQTAKEIKCEASRMFM